MKYGTAKIACRCDHKQQDEMHGKGVRIANAVLIPRDVPKAKVRCTVCGVEHEIAHAQVR